MTTELATPTIWEALDEWSHKLKPWARYVLSAAIGHGQLSTEQVNRAYARFLADFDLGPLIGDDAKGSVVGRPTTTLTQPLTLKNVFALDGVNALPDGTSLSFGPGLTIIYGQNGAGKTGFVRVLSNACFSRSRPKILGDIQASGGRPASAKFNYAIGIDDQDPAELATIDEQSSLRRIAVFDTEVARSLITQQEKFGFKPAGFDVFTEMARVCQLLDAKLTAEVAAKTRPNEFPSAFIGGGTPVHKLVAELGPTTDVTALRGLAQYGPNERARIDELNNVILALESRSPKAAIEAATEAQIDLATLRTDLLELDERFGVTSLERRRTLVKVAADTQATAKAASGEQFRRSLLKSVGTPAWTAFASIAHVLGSTEGEYPQLGAPCLLCERPLDAASRDHVEALFDFIAGDTQTAADEARSAVDLEADLLRAVSLDFFSADKRVRSHTARLAPVLALEIEDALNSLSAARDADLDSLKDLGTLTAETRLNDIIAKVTALETQVAADLDALHADNVDAQILVQRSERTVLRHRNVLSQQVGKIEKFVEDARWLEKARQAQPKLSTRFITDKEKELFGRIVGVKYRKRFAEECSFLECSVPVEIETVGDKGQTKRAMKMVGGTRPDLVLSEGEQRAVALADFLTEIGLNPAGAGIVLDDPVNSQDHARKHNVALRLVRESESRQVIIFTHDLVFLNQLAEAAAQSECDVRTHWIQRDREGRPGIVAEDDIPSTSRFYDSTDRARTALEQAKATLGTDQEEAIRRGAGHLRRTIEETVAKKLFKDTVPRWSDQVRIGTLRRINWDSGRVEDLCTLFEELSRVIDGHSHTDEAMGAPPSTAWLEKKIGEVDQLIKWAKADRK